MSCSLTPGQFTSRLMKVFALAAFVVGSVVAGVSELRAAELAWPVPEWQTAKPEEAGMSAAGVAKVGEWLKASGAKTGLLVRGGKIVGEWYFDGASADTKLIVYSTTKSFASTAAGLAIADGKLSLDTKVGELLPDVKPEGKKNVTVRQIISMDTGLHNNSGIGQMPKLFSYSLFEAPMDHEPGKHWNYNNTGLALLSPVMKKATGKEVDQVLKEKVFSKIGIGESDWKWDTREDHTIPYSGLHITARGLAKFGLLFLREGKWKDEQVVPAAWVKEATGSSQAMNPEYGYLWWNNTTGKKWPGVPKDAYAALGRSDNSMLIVPSLDLIVLRTIGDDQDKSRKIKIAELFLAACEAVEKK
ncbi:MAG: beta-lactamase family protein [Planctomycetia bacterium]|nr:beta-lactamase family protein [Planctomycetia bacterium]